MQNSQTKEVSSIKQRSNGTKNNSNDSPAYYELSSYI